MTRYALGVLLIVTLIVIVAVVTSGFAANLVDSVIADFAS